MAYTEEHMAHDRPLWPGPDRAAWKFAVPSFVDGVQEAFVVAAVRSALTRCEPGPHETVVPIADAWDRLTGVQVLVTEVHVKVVPPSRHVFEEPFTLDNGRLVRLMSFEQPMPLVEPQSVPAGQMVRAWHPRPTTSAALATWWSESGSHDDQAG